MSSRHSLLIVLVLAGCRSSAPSLPVERLALLPFENLTGDRSFDWLGAGAQVVLNRQLLPSRHVAVSVYANDASAALGRATRVLHGVIEKSASGLRLSATIEDSATHRQTARYDLAAPASALLPALNQLAHLLANDASPLPLKELGALAAFANASALTLPDARVAGMTRAAELDPTFALPTMSLAEMHLAAGRREKAQAALDAASRRQTDPVEQAQVALLKANLSQNQPAQAQALVKLVAAAPSQASLQIFAASQFERLHRQPLAITAFEQAVRVDPDNAEAWNRLGYAHAYAGALPAARQALEAYQRLEPNEPNPLDSLGEAHYLRGDFLSAAPYFKASYAKSPQFEGGRATLKAAYALLLDGKFKEADQAWDQYAKDNATSPLLPVARAHYLFTGGQAKPAVDGLRDAAAKAVGPTAALYHAHRCGLLLPADRAAAHQAAQAAMAAPSNVAVLCAFLSQPSATPARMGRPCRSRLPRSCCCRCPPSGARVCPLFRSTFLRSVSAAGGLGP